MNPLARINLNERFGIFRYQNLSQSLDRLTLRFINHVRVSIKSLFADPNAPAEPVLWPVSLPNQSRERWPHGEMRESQHVGSQDHLGYARADDRITESEALERTLTAAVWW